MVFFDSNIFIYAEAREEKQHQAHPVSGPRIHDFRIAATMIENGVTRIVTYNHKDFSPLPGITVVSPSELIQADEGAGIGAP